MKKIIKNEKQKEVKEKLHTCDSEAECQALSRFWTSANGADLLCGYCGFVVSKQWQLAHNCQCLFPKIDSWHAYWNETYQKVLLISLPIMSAKCSKRKISSSSKSDYNLRIPHEDRGEMWKYKCGILHNFIIKWKDNTNSKELSKNFKVDHAGSK